MLAINSLTLFLDFEDFTCAPIVKRKQLLALESLNEGPGRVKLNGVWLASPSRERYISPAEAVDQKEI
jgi:hypothetical protein